MNQGEYGNYIRVNVNEDISTSTNELLLVSPSGVTKTKTVANGLVVGSTNYTDNSVSPPRTFLANEYVEYQIIAGDIDEKGRWTFRASSESADTTVFKISDTRSFLVDE
jgi:hypothetical protein